MTRRTAPGQPWGTLTSFAAINSVREAARVVSQNNGQQVLFRGTVRTGGRWGWAETHYDATTKKWSTPRNLPELLGVTHLSLDPLTGTMIETHFRNGKLALFKRLRLVSKMVVHNEPPVSGLVINLSIGWEPSVAQYELGQGQTLKLVSFPSNAGYTNSLWAVSTKLGSRPYLIPNLQQGFLLEVAGYLLLGQTGPSTNGLAELNLTIPKSPVLTGLQPYFQNAVFSPRTGRGAFSDPLGLEIVK